MNPLRGTLVTAPLCVELVHSGSLDQQLCSHNNVTAFNLAAESSVQARLPVPGQYVRPAYCAVGLVHCAGKGRC